MNSPILLGRKPLIRSGSIPTKIVLVIALTAFADWLFYDQVVGLSLAIFLLGLTVSALFANTSLAKLRQKRQRAAVITVGILILALAPAIDDFNALSVTIGIVGVTVAVSIVANPYFFDSLSGALEGVQTLLVTGPFRLLPDLVRINARGFDVRTLIIWVLPLVLGSLFLLLFATANPLIEHWLEAFSPETTISQFNFVRLLFWFAVASVVWPFVYMKWRPGKLAAIVASEASAILFIAKHDIVGSGLFGAAAILNCLVLFNLLFAVQTGLDVVYLWGGVSLPDGFTYAAYAHRGAYPLIVTALLAAGFILAATQTGSVRTSRLIRCLLLLWTAQNIMLVISSILRLDLYVKFYSLTYWRVAAFVWMLLVAVGLVLIVARMMLDRSNRWLILANALVLALTLYASAFINFPAIIANYNVAHCLEVSGAGVTLDRAYLLDLGPEALPALDRYNQNIKARPFGLDHRDNIAATLGTELRSWRAWGFRKWRLQRYLASHAGRHDAAS